MPYPDENHQAPQPTEELSETEKHWNQNALGITTISTAVVGTALIVSDIPELSPDNWNAADLMTTLFLGLAVGLYMMSIQFLGQTMFPNRNLSKTARTARRRDRANITLSILYAISATAAVVIFITAASPLITKAEQSQEPAKTQQQTQETETDPATPIPEEPKPPAPDETIPPNKPPTDAVEPQGD